MAVDVKAKSDVIAEIIDGRVVDASDRVAVSIKGSVAGFPMTFEAIGTGWPFGVMYTIETNVATDEAKHAHGSAYMKMTVYPRVGRGLMGILTKLVLFESSGMPVGDKRLEKEFNFSYDNREVAERFIRYPNVSDILMRLEHTTKFSELVIKSDAGIYLAQPQSFTNLDLDVCRATVRTLGELGQVLFEAF